MCHFVKLQSYTRLAVPYNEKADSMIGDTNKESDRKYFTVQYIKKNPYI